MYTVVVLVVVVVVYILHKVQVGSIWYLILHTYTYYILVLVCNKYIVT